MAERTIRVLVVDDSAFMRAIISRIITAEPDMEVVGTARDGIDGLARAEQLEPDVITLDIEMPRMNGLEMLNRMMSTAPRPVLVVSSVARPQAEATMQALLLGAVDVVTKPSGPISLDMHVVGDELTRKIRAAATIPLDRLNTDRGRPLTRPRLESVPSTGRLSRLLVIGASTGGPGALGQVLGQLPGDIPAGILVIQHMPPGFTQSLARHLDADSPIRIREAAHGDRPEDGLCLVAMGGRHLALQEDLTVRLSMDPPRHGVRPAVDVTLETMPARWAGTSVVVILTGMGMDGAAGASRIKRLGGTVIAQDEATSVVYGMPRAIIEMGLADRVVGLPQMAKELDSRIRGSERRQAGGYSGGDR